MSRRSCHPECFPPSEKGWQGGPSRYQVDLVLNFAVIKMTHVGLVQLPICDGLDGTALILPNCVTGVGITLIHADDQTLPVNSHGKSTRTGKEFY